MKNLVIRMDDKGGGLVVHDYEEYHGEALNILSDREYYYPIRKNYPFIGVQEELNTLLTRATTSPPAGQSTLALTAPPAIYPISLTCIYRTVKKLSSHLKDSDDLIRHLQQVQMKEGLKSTHT